MDDLLLAFNRMKKNKEQKWTVKFSADVAQGASGSGFDGAPPVKQLEHAMTKLLPDGQPPTANTDFSTDALLKQRPPSIHWSGNNTREH